MARRRYCSRCRVSEQRPPSTGAVFWQGVLPGGPYEGNRDSGLERVSYARRGVRSANAVARELVDGKYTAQSDPDRAPLRFAPRSARSLRSRTNRDNRPPGCDVGSAYHKQDRTPSYRLVPLPGYQNPHIRRMSSIKTRSHVKSFLGASNSSFSVITRNSISQPSDDQ